LKIDFQRVDTEDLLDEIQTTTRRRLLKDRTVPRSPNW